MAGGQRRRGSGGPGQTGAAGMPGVVVGTGGDGGAGGPAATAGQPWRGCGRGRRPRWGRRRRAMAGRCGGRVVMAVPAVGGIGGISGNSSPGSSGGAGGTGAAEHTQRPSSTPAGQAAQAGRAGPRAGRHLRRQRVAPSQRSVMNPVFDRSWPISRSATSRTGHSQRRRQHRLRHQLRRRHGVGDQRRTNKDTATVPVGLSPGGGGQRQHRLRRQPRQHRLYDQHHLQRRRRRLLGVGSGPDALAVNPKGTDLYVANFQSNDMDGADLSLASDKDVFNIDFSAARPGWRLTPQTAPST